MLEQGWTGKKPTRNRLDAADILLEKGTEDHTEIQSSAAAAAAAAAADDELEQRTTDVLGLETDEEATVRTRIASRSLDWLMRPEYHQEKEVQR